MWSLARLQPLSSRPKVAFRGSYIWNHFPSLSLDVAVVSSWAQVPLVGWRVHWCRPFLVNEHALGLVTLSSGGTSQLSHQQSVLAAAWGSGSTVRVVCGYPSPRHYPCPTQPQWLSECLLYKHLLLYFGAEKDLWMVPWLEPQPLVSRPHICFSPSFPLSFLDSPHSCLMLLLT